MKIRINVVAYDSTVIKIDERQFDRIKEGRFDYEITQKIRRNLKDYDGSIEWQINDKFPYEAIEKK